MTDNLLTSWTLSAPPSQTVFPLDKPSSKDATPKVKPKKEEESIQCICNYSGDDGHTIFCEECKTWQHIACYYPGREREALEEDFRHSCADCEPRELDRHKAAERMQAKLGIQFSNGEVFDKKSKRPSSKTHKKKAKPNELQLNGQPPASGIEGSKHGSSHDHPHSHPPAKKVKTSHKSSQSVSAQAPKRSPSHSAPKVGNHGHPLSPATTPPDLLTDFEYHPFLPQLLTLYEDAAEIVDTNIIATLKTTDRMSLWSRPEGADMFRQDTGVEFDEAVQRITPSPLDPPLVVATKELRSPKGTLLRWPYLTTPSPIDRDVPVMELNGLVGLQKDYCDDTHNRYKELSAPLPFVFFPSSIPLYIDTRREGSNARYVRRSCRPNTRLLAYLSDDSDWHFWLVSERPIAAKEEITVGWDISLLPPYRARLERLLDLSDDHSVTDIVADIDQCEYDALSQSIDAVLSEYGGCACGLNDDCAFTRFQRQFQEKSQQRLNAPKRRRAKSKPHTISPTSTGQATNSRAASEGRLEELPDHDNHSSTGSFRSRPPSRDRTPGRLGSFDSLGILTEPTNRDKRKVQIAETLFQKSAQEEQQPPRKKKKVPDGSTSTNSSKSKSRTSTSLGSEKTIVADGRRFVDAGTSISNNGSPASLASRGSVDSATNEPRRQASVASTGHRRYCDAAIQTEAAGGILRSEQSPKPRPQRRVISLTMRLMDQKRRNSALAQQRTATSVSMDSPTTTKSSQGSPESVHKQIPISSPASTHGDTTMPDAPPTVVNTDETSPLLSNGVVPTSPVTIEPPKLRVQMPPVPTFSSSSSVAAISTPISATASVVQSPFSALNLPSPFAPPAVNGVSASPVKKKMSLSEYKNKANKAAASAKAPADAPHPLKTASLLADTLKPVSNGEHDTKDTGNAPEATGAKKADTADPVA